MIENPIVFGIQLTIIGLLVVFFTLLLISLIVSTVFGRVEQWAASLGLSKREETPAPPVLEPVPEPVLEVTPSELAPELLAVITAAIGVAIDKRAKIKTIRYRRTPASTSWSVQGRTTIMASHQIKRY